MGREATAYQYRSTAGPLTPEDIAMDEVLGPLLQLAMEARFGYQVCQHVFKTLNRVARRGLAGRPEGSLTDAQLARLREVAWGVEELLANFSSRGWLLRLLRTSRLDALVRWRLDDIAALAEELTSQDTVAANDQDPTGIEDPDQKLLAAGLRSVRRLREALSTHIPSVMAPYGAAGNPAAMDAFLRRITPLVQNGEEPLRQLELQEETQIAVAALSVGPHRALRHPDLQLFWWRHLAGLEEVPWSTLWPHLATFLANTPRLSEGIGDVRAALAILQSPEHVRLLQSAVHRMGYANYVNAVELDMAFGALTSGGVCTTLDEQLRLLTVPGRPVLLARTSKGARADGWAKEAAAAAKAAEKAAARQQSDDEGPASADEEPGTFEERRASRRFAMESGKADDDEWFDANSFSRPSSMYYSTIGNGDDPGGWSAEEAALLMALALNVPFYAADRPGGARLLSWLRTHGSQLQQGLILDNADLLLGVGHDDALEGLSFSFRPLGSLALQDATQVLRNRLGRGDASKGGSGSGLACETQLIQIAEACDRLPGLLRLAGAAIRCGVADFTMMATAAAEALRRAQEMGMPEAAAGAFSAHLISHCVARLPAQARTVLCCLASVGVPLEEEDVAAAELSQRHEVVGHVRVWLLRCNASLVTPVVHGGGASFTATAVMAAALGRGGRSVRPSINGSRPPSRGYAASSPGTLPSDAGSEIGAPTGPPGRNINGSSLQETGVRLRALVEHMDGLMGQAGELYASGCRVSALRFYNNGRVLADRGLLLLPAWLRQAGPSTATAAVFAAVMTRHLNGICRHVLLPGQLARTARELAALLPSLPSPHDRLTGHLAAARTLAHLLSLRAASRQLAAADALAKQLYPALAGAVQAAEALAQAQQPPTPPPPGADQRRSRSVGGSNTAELAGLPAQVVLLALAHAEVAAAHRQYRSAAHHLICFLDLLSAVGLAGSLEGAQARMQLGDLTLRLGYSPTDAAVHYEAAAAILTQLYGQSHFRVGRAMLAAARCGPEAVAAASAAAAAASAGSPAHGLDVSPMVPTPASDRYFAAAGQRPLEVMLKDCLYVQQLSQGKFNLDVAEVEVARGSLMCRRNRPDEALSCGLAALGVVLEVLGDGTPQVAECLDLVAAALRQQRRPAAAAAIALHAQAIRIHAQAASSTGGDDDGDRAARQPPPPTEALVLEHLHVKPDADTTPGTNPATPMAAGARATTPMTAAANAANPLLRSSSGRPPLPRPPSSASGTPSAAKQRIGSLLVKSPVVQVPVPDEDGTRAPSASPNDDDDQLRPSPEMVVLEPGAEDEDEDGPESPTVVGRTSASRADGVPANAAEGERSGSDKSTPIQEIPLRTFFSAAAVRSSLLLQDRDSEGGQQPRQLEAVVNAAATESEAELAPETDPGQGTEPVDLAVEAQAAELDSKPDEQDGPVPEQPEEEPLVQPPPPQQLLEADPAQPESESEQPTDTGMDSPMVTEVALSQLEAEVAAEKPLLTQDTMDEAEQAEEQEQAAAESATELTEDEVLATDLLAELQASQGSDESPEAFAVADLIAAFTLHTDEPTADAPEQQQLAEQPAQAQGQSGDQTPAELGAEDEGATVPRMASRSSGSAEAFTSAASVAVVECGAEPGQTQGGHVSEEEEEHERVGPVDLIAAAPALCLRDSPVTTPTEAMAAEARALASALFCAPVAVSVQSPCISTDGANSSQHASPDVRLPPPPPDSLAKAAILAAASRAATPRDLEAMLNASVSALPSQPMGTVLPPTAEGSLLTQSVAASSLTDASSGQQHKGPAARSSLGKSPVVDADVSSGDPSPIPAAEFSVPTALATLVDPEEVLIGEVVEGAALTARDRHKATETRWFDAEDVAPVEAREGALSQTPARQPSGGAAAPAAGGAVVATPAGSSRTRALPQPGPGTPGPASAAQAAPLGAQGGAPGTSAVPSPDGEVIATATVPASKQWICTDDAAAVAGPHGGMAWDAGLPDSGSDRVLEISESDTDSAGLVNSLIPLSDQSGGLLGESGEESARELSMSPQQAAPPPQPVAAGAGQEAQSREVAMRLDESLMVASRALSRTSRVSSDGADGVARSVTSISRIPHAPERSSHPGPGPSSRRLAASRIPHLLPQNPQPQHHQDRNGDHHEQRQPQHEEHEHQSGHPQAVEEQRLSQQLHPQRSMRSTTSSLNFSADLGSVQGSVDSLQLAGAAAGGRRRSSCTGARERVVFYAVDTSIRGANAQSNSARASSDGSLISELTSSPTASRASGRIPHPPPGSTGTTPQPRSNGSSRIPSAAHSRRSPVAVAGEGELQEEHPKAPGSRRPLLFTSLASHDGPLSAAASTAASAGTQPSFLAETDAVSSPAARMAGSYTAAYLMQAQQQGDAHTRQGTTPPTGGAAGSRRGSLLPQVGAASPSPSVPRGVKLHNPLFIGNSPRLADVNYHDEPDVPTGEHLSGEQSHSFMAEAGVEGEPMSGPQQWEELQRGGIGSRGGGGVAPLGGTPQSAPQRL
ncbi:hypothetical protein GPECTOR_6g681 [Gonium pectorale]|uniref:Uncharacterized protein n=1 Tax=Gonium pectorale TaxID=33097 RepID=A0A150GVH6_GONPE|nr:hypothetical protein GPECTOR_6g681 [Gonium pectorale]|eukprot:KXZ53763.1 hypothetical protein GPECTOR_6g681 [Gonium pectorale]